MQRLAERVRGIRGVPLASELSRACPCGVSEKAKNRDSPEENRSSNRT